MFQKVANMAPTWDQVGVMLDSRIIFNASKSEKKTTPKMGQESSSKSIPSGNHNAATAQSGAESKWPPQGGWGAT